MNPPDHIQQAKLYPPQVRPSHVARPRLTERLSAGLAVRLTVIAAPAGFGKSSLIGEWRTANPTVPMAWVALDPDDNDPVRFWKHVAAALERAVPGSGEGALALLAGGSSIPPRAVARSIMEHAADLTQPVVLALDDFHTITAPEVCQSLLPLLEETGSHLRLWLITRADPALPLARLRAHQELLELRAEDLRFQTDEAAALLNDARGLGLPAAWTSALAERTEGWAAGLQLAAISLQGNRDTAGFIQAFTGTHRHIVDYLSEEVLVGLPSRTRAFLLQTAILERLSGGLCDAVTGEADGQAMLEELERTGLFLIPLDDDRRWYRYHHLFADVLRVAARQQSEGPGTRELHRRAALWCHEHALPEDAVRHALAAGEHEWAADWLEGLVSHPGSSPGVVTMLKLLEALPPDVRASRPTLTLALPGVLYQAGQYEKLLATLAVMPRPQEPHRLGQLLVLEAGAAFYRRDWQATVTICRDALPLLAPGDLLSQARLWELLTAALMFRGELAEAEAASEQAVSITGKVGSPVHVLTALSARALIVEARGGLRQAIGMMNDALARARPMGLDGLIMSDFGPLLQAAGDLDGAWQVLTAGTEQCRQNGLMTHALFGEVRLAHLAQVMGREAAADEHFARAAEVVREAMNPSLTAALAATQAQVALLRGNLAGAAAWADSLSTPQSPERTVLIARIRLAQGRPAEAAALLAPMPDHPRVLIWRALALHAAGDHGGADAAAARGVAWAEAEGYRQLFSEAGAPLAALIARIQGRPDGGLLEPLTDREREVLALIAAGASNQEIAERLFLAVPTVKRHVGGLLGKLGASSRTHLVAVARERGIL